MIRLKSDLITLEDDIKKVLEKKQKTISDLSTFTEKSTKAGKAWESKGSPDVFKKIKTHLISLCVSVEICNYCESNEANDIEHIFPKKLFPHRTFLWKTIFWLVKNVTLRTSKTNLPFLTPWIQKM